MHPHIDAGIEKALKLRYFRKKGSSWGSSRAGRAGWEVV